jgi:acyl carrier protein
MNRDQILSQLTEILEEAFDRDDITVTPASTADDFEEWDSVTHINIVIAAEIRFGIKFRAAETETLKNIGDFIDLIEAKLAKK